MPDGSTAPRSRLLSAGLAPPLGGEPDETAHRRKLRRAEGHVAWMRDAVAAFVWLTVPWLLPRPGISTTPFLLIAVLGTIYTAIAHAGHRYRWGDLRTRTLATSLGDGAVVLGMLSVSGGWTSPLTPLLYVTMAAYAYRYELAYGVAFGIGYGAAYVAVLAAVGDLGADPTALVLRVGLLVATGLLASLSSKSFLEAEVERSRVQHTYQDLLETVPGDIALIRRDAGRLGSEKGEPDPEAVRSALADWMPSKAVGRAREALVRVFETGETVEFEFSVEEEGHTSTYRTVVGPLAEDGHVAAAVVVSTDVTERKRAQRRLRDHARALRQSNEALARYASLTAHDLREPLRDIVRYLQRIVRREDELSAESREELGFVVRRARRLDELVRALHRFAEVDERPLQTRSVDLDEALARALDEIDTTPPPAMQIHTGELATITADPRAIEEILEHLLANVHQHAGRERVNVWIDSQRTEEGWQIAVEDDGQGIPPRYHGELFEPFRPRGLDPDDRSARMGLATVRRLVERLGGEIEVDSEPGAGARFTFTVPRRPVLAEPDEHDRVEAA